MSKRPRLLDLFCGQGGCSMGYRRAGFEVVGVDYKSQPRYPFTFVNGDALETCRMVGKDFDVIHASPPCQRYSQVNRLAHLAGREYPDLLPPTRELLRETGKVWVIENVRSAPMTNAIMLCGSMFGLKVRRHRLFECSHVLFQPDCDHKTQDQGGAKYPTAFRSAKYLTADGKKSKRFSTVVQVYGNTGGKKLWPEAMGIDWMTSKGLSQAIPPAYTEYIGKQLMRILD